MNMPMHLQGRRIAIRWILFVLFLYTVPAPWFIAVAGGLAPAIQLLTVGIVAAFNLGGDGNLFLSISFLAPGLIATIIYYFVAQLLSYPLASIERNNLRTLLLVIITAGLLTMATFPVYYEGGHNTGRAVSIFAYKDNFPALFIIYVAVLSLSLAILFVLQHRSIPIRGIWKNPVGKPMVLLMSGAFLVAFVYVNFALVVCMPAAKLGISSAQVCVGRAVASGEISHAIDDSNAMAWYRRAADQGNIDAARELYALNKSEKWLRVVAESGDHAAQYELSRQLTRQFKGNAAQGESLLWLQTAAKNANANAQYDLAMLLSKGDVANGLGKDPDESLRWLKLAAEQDHPDALAILVNAYKHGLLGLSLDLDQAMKMQQRLVQVEQSKASAKNQNIQNRQSELEEIKILKKQIESADIHALKELAFKQLDMRTAESRRRGIEYLEQAANQDDAGAQYELGKIYAYGRYDIPKDGVKTIFWWTKAANNRHLKSMEALSRVYLNGKADIEKDYQKAQFYLKEVIHAYQDNLNDDPEKDKKLVYWERELSHIQDQIQKYMGGEFVPFDQLRRYAKGGEAQAQYQLAQQLYIMYGLTLKTGAESLVWYEKAAEAGHTLAQWRMFQLKSQGITINTSSQDGTRTQVLMQKDNKEAVRYLKLAASNHHPQAMRELGLSYEQGRHGIKKDLQKARSVFHELVEAQEDNRYQWDVDKNFIASNKSAYETVKRSQLMLQVMRAREKNTSPFVAQLIDIKKQFKSEYRKKAFSACLPNAQGACTKQLSQSEKDKIAEKINLKRDRKIESLLENASKLDKQIWGLVKEADDEIQRRSKVAFAALKQSKTRTYDSVVNELLHDNLDLLEKRDRKINDVKRRQALQSETP